jgi:hypothetical protein
MHEAVKAIGMMIWAIELVHKNVTAAGVRELARNAVSPFVNDFSIMLTYAVTWRRKPTSSGLSSKVKESGSIGKHKDSTR